MPGLRTITGTDLRVSPVCLGTALFGSVLDTQASYAQLDAFVDLGGNFFDTARVYADWIPGERARSEKLLGKWMRERRNRARVVILTKGGQLSVHDGSAPVSPELLPAEIGESLDALQTDVIDFFVLHRDNTAVPVDALIDVLNQQRAAGKIRWFGCSNWSVARIIAANEYARASGQQGFSGNQVMWSAAKIDPRFVQDKTVVVMDEHMRALHRDTGMLCMPFSSQASGLLSKMEQRPIHYWLRHIFLRPSCYPWSANRRRLAAIRAIARTRRVPVSQVAMAFLVSQPFVTVPVIGVRNVEQLRDVWAACDVHLSDEELRAIDV